MGVAEDVLNKSWYMKYQPTELKDLIFDNNEHRDLMSKWVLDESIDGNILFYGKPGLGKTASSEILIRTCIKAQGDLFIAKKRDTEEMREDVSVFVQKNPMRSKKKIVYIEEFDKLHPEALNILKNGIMEKHQNICSFICCTNYIDKVKRKDEAILTRFTYKIGFLGNNVDGIYNRLNEILHLENAIFDQVQLKQFIEKNYKMGIRELINYLQSQFRSSGNNTIKFDNNIELMNLEETVILSIMNILKVIPSTDVNTKRIILEFPTLPQSTIGVEYNKIVHILHNNIDINYDNIFDRLYEMMNHIPSKLIIGKYADMAEFKRYQSLNLLACITDLIKSFIEINY